MPGFTIVTGVLLRSLDVKQTTHMTLEAASCNEYGVFERHRTVGIWRMKAF